MPLTAGEMSRIAAVGAEDAEHVAASSRTRAGATPGSRRGRPARVAARSRPRSARRSGESSRRRRGRSRCRRGRGRSRRPYARSASRRRSALRAPARSFSISATIAEQVVGMDERRPSASPRAPTARYPSISANDALAHIDGSRGVGEGHPGRRAFERAPEEPLALLQRRAGRELLAEVPCDRQHAARLSVTENRLRAHLDRDTTAVLAHRAPTGSESPARSRLSSLRIRAATASSSSGATNEARTARPPRRARSRACSSPPG